MNIAALIKKIFDYIVWVAFFGFLLLGVVIYITNNTYPGDKMYPFKLKFEEFTLLTSKILNKQIDFSIDLVSKRSYEVAKILSPNNSAETLSRLDTQVELTAASITQISDPIEKKKAAEQYIVKLNEASTILSEKQKEFNTTTTTTSDNQSQPTEQPSPYPITQQASTPTLAPTTKSTLTEPTTAQQPTVQPTAIPTIQPTTIIFPTPTTTPSTTNENVTQQIINSQETIQQAIIEMQNLATVDNRDLKKEHKPELKKDLKPELKQEMSNKSDEKQIEIKDAIKIKDKSESN